MESFYRSTGTHFEIENQYLAAENIKSIAHHIDYICIPLVDLVGIIIIIVYLHLNFLLINKIKSKNRLNNAMLADSLLKMV